MRNTNSKTRNVTGTASLTRQNLASMNDDIVEHDLGSTASKLNQVRQKLYMRLVVRFSEQFGTSP